MTQTKIIIVDDKSLSSNMPPMVVFPEASLFYTKWQHSLESRGVKIRLSTEVTKVMHRGADGVTVLVRPRRPQPDKHNPAGADTDLPETVEQYDEIVLCVLADTAKHLLGKTSTWAERRVLGATMWSDDITVTHSVRESIRHAAIFPLTTMPGRGLHPQVVRLKV
jgi:protoporphyrinogen oxidase